MPVVFWLNSLSSKDTARVAKSWPAIEKRAITASNQDLQICDFCDGHENFQTMVGNESAQPGHERRPTRQLHQVQPPGDGSQRDLQQERSRSRTRDEATEDADAQNMRRHEEAKIKQIKSTVEDEFAQTIPQDTMKSIKKFSLDLASKVEQLQKTNARMKKNEEELQILAQNRVPNGMKPVPFPYETPFLDSLKINKEEWKVQFPEDTSLREARKMIHCSYLRIMREIDHEIAKAQRVDLRSSTKKSAFVEKCTAAYTAKASLWKDLDLDFEDEPRTNNITEEVLRIKASNVYDKTIDHAATLLQKRKEQEKAQQMKKDGLLKSMLNKSPEDLLHMTIDARIEERMPNKPKPAAKPTAQEQRENQAKKQFNSAKAFVATTKPDGDVDMHDPMSIAHFWLQDSQTNKQHGKGNNKKSSKGHSKGNNKGNNKGMMKGKGKGKGSTTPGHKGKATTATPSGKPHAKGANQRQHEHHKGSRPFLDKRLHHGKKGKGKGDHNGKRSSKAGKGKGSKGQPW